MKAYLYCTKAKPYLYNSVGNFIVNIEWKETGKKPYYTLCKKIDEFQHLELNGQVVARCVCKEAFDLIADELGNYVPFSVKDNCLADIDVCPKACLSKEQLAEYGKGKDLYAYHLEQVEALEKPMQISDFYSNIVCTKPLKRAPQSFQKCYIEIPTPNGPWGYEVKTCYLFSDRSPYVAKILNGEKVLEIRKSAIRRMKMSTYKRGKK